jgi:hypothetical protein
VFLLEYGFDDILILVLCVIHFLLERVLNLSVVLKRKVRFYRTNIFALNEGWPLNWCLHRPGSLQKTSGKGLDP